MTVICDWLDVTCAPDNTPELDVLDVLQLAGAECLLDDDSGSSWRVGDGVFKIQRKPRFHRFSASGSVLGHLRDLGLFDQYLGALSEVPHAVTRLDAAYDVHVDAAPVIAKLRKRYPHECSLTRKALRTKSILESRPDGRESGTWYVGHRSNGRVTARVYDKQLQMLNVRNVEIPPTTRYELTFRKDIGATLRDAACPSLIFWHYASPTLLKRPEGVPEWSNGWGVGWIYTKPDIAPAGLLRSRIESSAELKAILALADRADCMDWCSHLLVQLVERYTRKHAPDSDHKRSA